MIKLGDKVQYRYASLSEIDSRKVLIELSALALAVLEFAPSMEEFEGALAILSALKKRGNTHQGRNCQEPGQR